VTEEPAVRRGRADLHVHTLASDGVSSVTEILDRVEADGFLDVLGIADHERIDAALAARRMAHDRGLRVEVVVGEEVSTRGGHLLALFLERPIPSLRSLAWTIEAVHDQGGIAIAAHPLVPHPMCAQGFALRRLLGAGDPSRRPDAIETFNPTALGRYRHDAVVRFAGEHGLPPVGNSDAHVVDAVASGWTSFPGRTADDYRRALASGQTRHHGAFHGSLEQLGVYRRQLGKYARGWRATVGGRVRRDGTGRDLGYPGGTRRPAQYDPGDPPQRDDA
jgi:predicted metal-dependent phosphoesterase TrpH